MELLQILLMAVAVAAFILALGRRLKRIGGWNDHL